MTPIGDKYRPCDNELCRSVGDGPGTATLDLSSSRGWPGRRNGQILVIVLLAIALLAGLVFYVFNVGDQIDRRLRLQNAADAAAVSGAGWMARSMNLVAMDNVTIARLISLAIVLDSVPLAAEMTVAEHTGPDSLPVVLSNQLLRGVPGTRGDFLRNGLTYIYRQMGPQTDSMKVVDQQFDQGDERMFEGGFDVGQATRWPDGSIWQAAIALDRLSRAVRDSAGVLAQADTVRLARSSGAAMAMLVPIAPAMPARQGRFDDFFPLFTDYLEIINSPSHGLFSHRLVHRDLPGELDRSGDLLRDINYIGRRRWHYPGFFIAGGAIPDYTWPQRLGPFASVYRWRDAATLTDDQWGVDDFRRWQIGYRTYGPLENAMMTVLGGFGQMGSWATDARVAWTLRFPQQVRRIATLKLAYMLGLSSPRELQYSDRWITDFDQAKKFAQDHPDQVASIRYYRVTVDSKVSWDDPRWMTGQSTDPEVRNWFSWELSPPLDRLPSETPAQWGERQPLESWGYDPWDSRSRRYDWWQPPGQKVARDVWVDKRRRQVRSYEYFNWLARPILDDQGLIVDYDKYTLYTVTWYVWGGLEVRDPVTISNPLAGANLDELPAPILLDTTDEQYDWIDVADGQAVRVRPFKFLAVAAGPDVARAWRQKFVSDNPSGQGAVAVAEAKLFNPDSWDLWTQSWQVQLAPVTDWPGWVDKVNAGVADVPVTGGPPSAEQVEAMGRYMQSLEGELTDEFLTH